MLHDSLHAEDAETILFVTFWRLRALKPLYLYCFRWHGRWKTSTIKRELKAFSSRLMLNDFLHTEEAETIVFVMFGAFILELLKPEEVHTKPHKQHWVEHTQASFSKAMQNSAMPCKATASTSNTNRSVARSFQRCKASVCTPML